MDDKVAIAVVGLGCRFPGADNAEEFWRVLVNCENHVKDIPKDRWNNETFYNKDKNAVGKSYVTKAGFLKDHDMWDNKLFGVSDVEAARIDPQQRYVLECVHMAMEDGGFTRAKMSGTKTGVYIGCMNDDYKIMSMQDSSGNTNYSATGSSTTVISSRVSYVFNLQGPCLTVDTACSSAMMAIHLGCQAIRSGDCCQAICGGVSSIMYPDMFITLSKARMMSAVGQCQTFCDTADGYARGEGCGVVILKPLKQAQLDNDKIWGVIVTGTNQDGRAAQPMTAPSGSQQQALFKHVYTKYDIDPSTIQYIEAHDKSHSYPAEKIELSSPNKYRPRTHLNVQPMEIINGYFQKQTKAGWSHRVYVTLLEHQDTDNDAKWITIQWCKKPGRPTKSLSVSTCDSISMLNLNRQHSIVVQARDRQLVICTPEHEVAQRWMTVLENCAKRPTIL
ncbi:phenolphthiocerol/phthiocerol polyketide synthase subunit C-like isoform X2 [Mya arenaria]|uniref:phenolphthiocerol/phthiocerol polyketide synthase subunit C-like isoform X2 n=1 Tax=Mya arenaria TaxID=6604 RepID=UPI0022E4310C|nr:phenolphthiocerol/phthiocerol polyketide synthase subunit C-like isoform X2 [Mya arenaria]XP_052816271.1 phenolphthiocerol/phthiocerol polyketide synthase subunit C-like isoform X2 [Mya arenaria]